MSDPVTLSAAIVANLAFTKFIEGSANKLAEQFTETAIAKMEQLRQLIWNKLRGKPRAENALIAVEQGSKPDLERLAVYLQDEMDDDPNFAAQVQALAQDIHAGKIQDNSVMVQTNYDNARGWQTKVEGGTAYIGEINFHGQPPTS